MGLSSFLLLVQYVYRPLCFVKTTTTAAFFTPFHPRSLVQAVVCIPPTTNVLFRGICSQ